MCERAYFIIVHINKRVCFDWDKHVAILAMASSVEDYTELHCLGKHSQLLNFSKETD